MARSQAKDGHGSGIATPGGLLGIDTRPRAIGPLVAEEVIRVKLLHFTRVDAAFSFHGLGDKKVSEIVVVVSLGLAVDFTQHD